MRDMTAQPGSQQATELASKLERTNNELIALAEHLTEAQWNARSVEEDWPIGAVVAHVANAFPSFARTIAGIAGGETFPVTWEMLATANAKQVAAYEDGHQDETLASLRRNSAELVGYIQSLTDVQLDAVGHIHLLGHEPVSTARLIEDLVIRHTVTHMASIRESIGIPASPVGTDRSESAS
jgi:uncharacterized damage-inducible protein DinB